MKPVSENIIAELLRKWFSGEARQQDVRMLEELAEDDPFLAEALEGYRRFPESNHTERIERIRARLAGRYRRRRGLIIYLPRIAAALALLLLAGGGFWYLNQRETPEDFAQTNTVVREPERPAAEPAAKTGDPQASTGLQSEPNESEESQTSTLHSRKAPAKTTITQAGKERAPTLAEAVPEKKETAPDNPPGAPQPSLYLYTPPENEKGDSAADGMKNITKAEALQPSLSKELSFEEGFNSLPSRQDRSLYGRVLDQNGEPIIGAAVLAVGTTQGTITDIDGSFRLAVDSSIDQLAFSYTGYSSVLMDIPSYDTIEVALLEATPLEEVVVMGFDAKKAERSRASVSEVQDRSVDLDKLKQPQPIGGFKKLERYIRKNLQYPKEAEKKGLEGTVLLEFRIQSDGTLAGFRAISSPGKEFELEAVRLLKEGPAWETPGGIPTDYRYEIAFTLRD